MLTFLIPEFKSSITRECHQPNDAGSHQALELLIGRLEQVTTRLEKALTLANNHQFYKGKKDLVYYSFDVRKRQNINYI